MAGAIDQRVLEDPADAGGIRTQHRGHAARQLPLDAAQVLEHAATCPVDVGSIFEDRVDERQAEERRSAHEADPGRREQPGRDRVGDLILDQVGALAWPFREDDDLDVGEIGNRVERRVAEGPDAPHARRQHRQDREPAVAGTGGDDAPDRPGGFHVGPGCGRHH